MARRTFLSNRQVCVKGGMSYVEISEKVIGLGCRVHVRANGVPPAGPARARDSGQNSKWGARGDFWVSERCSDET
jgi:hypothetical protein